MKDIKKSDIYEEINCPQTPFLRYGVTQEKTEVSAEAYELLSCLRPIIRENVVVKTEGLNIFEQRLNKLLADKKPVNIEPNEVCVIENELLGLRLTLASKIFPVSALQEQGIKTIQKIIKTTPTRIPLGIN